MSLRMGMSMGRDAELKGVLETDVDVQLSVSSALPVIL